MKVLILTHRLPYAPDRGDRIRSYFLIREIAKFADVSLFSLVHDAEEEARATTIPFVSRVSVARVPRLRNLAVGAARLTSRRPLTHSLLDAPTAKTSLQRLVDVATPDVVLAYCSGMARFALTAPLATRPFVLDMVDVDSAKWSALARETRGLRRWVYQREARTLAAFEAAAVRQAGATLVVNARERDLLMNVVKTGTVHVIESGIDIQAFAPPGEPAETSSVVFCGVMNYRPNEEGVRWFSESVWPIVTRHRPDARFLVVGANPTREIRRLADRHSSNDVTGSVESVQPYLWKSAVSVAPLRLARGLQNKVLEALAAGLPAVVTPNVLNGLPDEARAGCVEADDPERFAAAVIRLLELPAVHRRRLAAQARLEALTWKRRLQPLESILRSASSASSRGHRAS
jgi:sugar transferase (PEP-CTERM/EpsH1 system associated)